MTSPKISVRVPATSANLGPGFDALGLALQVYNRVSIEQSPSGIDEIFATGEGADILNAGESGKNIALIAARALLHQLKVPLIPLKLELHNAIPLARGLGSSSAARVGALVAANEWAKRNWNCSATGSTLLAIATKLEGHPDNVAPALLGGLVASAMREDGAVFSSRLPAKKFPTFVVFTPQNELETEAARAVLPQTVSLQDATFNIARASLLFAALMNEEFEMLREATRDRLHQSQRASLMPAFDAVSSAAIEAGAFAATLSGAGPCILAWLPDGSTPEGKEVVAKTIIAMQNAAAEKRVFGAAQKVEVDLEGSVVENG